MRQHWIRGLAGCLLLVGLGCCHKCDVCHSIGGPCGSYSMAGRSETPPEAVTVPESTPVPQEKSPGMSMKPTKLSSGGWARGALRR